MEPTPGRAFTLTNMNLKCLNLETPKVHLWYLYHHHIYLINFKPKFYLRSSCLAQREHLFADLHLQRPGWYYGWFIVQRYRTSQTHTH